MVWVHIFLRNKKEAKQALLRADEINPNSSYAKAACSVGMSYLGEYQDADTLMASAIPLHPLPYWWFNLPPIFNALLAGEYEKMLFIARKIGTPAGIHDHIFEMIALFYLNKTENLKQVFSIYAEKFPDGIAHALTAWPKILFDEALVEQMNFALREITSL